MPREAMFLDQFETVHPRVYSHLVEVATDLEGLLPGDPKFREVVKCEAWVWDRQFGRLFQQRHSHHAFMRCLYLFRQPATMELETTYNEEDKYLDQHMGFHMSSVSSLHVVYAHNNLLLTAQEKMLFKGVKFVQV